MHRCRRWQVHSTSRRCDKAQGEGLPHFERHVQAALEKCLDRLQVRYGETAECIGGKTCRARRDRRLRRGFGEQARIAQGGRCGQLAFVNDERAGNEIAEPLMARGDEDADNAHDVGGGQEVNDAHQIASERFEKRDGASALLDDTDLCDALSRRLAVPERFEQREIAPLQEEGDQDHEGDEPLCARGFELLQAGQEEHRAQDQSEHDCSLQQRIDQDRDEATADSGKRELQRDKLRRLNAKLITEFHGLEPVD